MTEEDDNIRIRCKCGAFIDTNVLTSNGKSAKECTKFLIEHLKHMYKGEKVNIFMFKLNGEIQGFDYHEVFDEDYVVEEVKKLMRRSEPDDVIEIINMSKN